ncbi:MAG: Aspartate-semialdehyde dehydrogenase 2 [Chlamydiales bacterium]|nr:Aspartate-semialdehyde dehydrogenase 2 [Chlamydiales bacterium]
MKIPVGILGATGVIGQQYVALLHDHPWFEIKSLAATHASPSYKQAVQSRWHASKPIPEGYSLSSLENFEPCPLIFSALPNTLAAVYEPKLVEAGSTVISSASCHRGSAPIIIPEINAHHLTGKLITKPNCALQAFLLPLAPLHRKANICGLSVTTLQAMSGAGHSGLLSQEIEGNVIPLIDGEEEKLENEPLKILEARFPISAHCNRIPVIHGHMACVSVAFEYPLSYEDILAEWNQPNALTLPSAPRYPVIYCDDPARPQTRLDRDAGEGMSVTVGRLRHCPLLEWRFVALSHNTIRGGAGGGVLTAELLKQEGHLG